MTTARKKPWYERMDILLIAGAVVVICFGIKVALSPHQGDQSDQSTANNENYPQALRPSSISSDEFLGSVEIGDYKVAIDSTFGPVGLRMPVNGTTDDAYYYTCKDGMAVLVFDQSHRLIAKDKVRRHD